MPRNNTFPEVEQAFKDRPQLKRRLCDFLDQYPTQHDLFRDISTYVIELKSNAAHDTAAGPASKKRKLENDGLTTNGAAGKSSIGGTAGAWSDAGAAACFSAKDISFTVPQRKKLTLELVAAGKKEPTRGGIRAVSADGTVEFGVAWQDVEQIVCLPVPEKAKRQHNFVVIPRYGDGVTPVPEGVPAVEPIVWTSPEPLKKELNDGQHEAEPMRTARVLDRELQHHGKKVVFPDVGEFVSSIPQSHLKGEQGFHVKAFRGSKDGFLFFLSVGILWAFKKPLAFFSFDSISSISYTSVLQRTFNLNISTTGTPEDPKGLEFEFSMLDQADYAGIDAYVKRHGLHDASMAEQRKAKRLNVNGPSVKAENGNGTNSGTAAGEDDGEEESELQKAERLLQDQEDEMEEDYDPGSGGESDGSGSSDEEEEYEDGAGEEEAQEGDLVADELGSDADEVNDEG